jgi:hypothetical protein
MQSHAARSGLSRETEGGSRVIILITCPQKDFGPLGRSGFYFWGFGMIRVHGAKDDYAIMKQVQQIKLAYPHMTIGMLDQNVDFSQLDAAEKLFLVSHGNAASGDLSNIDRYELLGWLKADGRGVPRDFGGIVICSCYSGLGGDHSLARHIAQGLAGKAAAGTTVAGANGYSFGTPEFGSSGLSSVLRQELKSFYTFTEETMASEWPKVKPTHAGGVLATKWNIQVNIDKTIQENLDTNEALRSTPDAVKDQLTIFAQEGKGLESQLKDAIKQVAGDAVVERADNIVAGNTPAVNSWNAAIARQYQLFDEYYLWAPAQAAFTVVPVPAA